MRDFTRLREQLRIALLCAPLAAGGCAKQENKPAGGAPATATAAADAAPKAIIATTLADAAAADAAPMPAVPTAPRTADAGPQPLQPLDERPRCPSGVWCGTLADAQRFADQSAGEVNGCPKVVVAPKDAKDLPKDWPRNVTTRMAVSEAATKVKRDAGDGTACCYDWYIPCPGGRPLFDGERAIVAAPRLGESVPLDAAAAALPEALRQRLAQGWTDDALSEHASIAAFARATIELMAAGAPPELLADCQRAGLDEIRHAERCFALAARYAGRTVDAGALPSLPPRASTAVQLARDTFLEGCVSETISALVATRALAACEDPLVARTLTGIVKDETRHAALAWRTVSWAIAEGGRDVIDDLRRLAEARRPSAATVTETSDLELARHGRLDAAAVRATERDAWTQVIEPTLAQLLTDATQETCHA